MRNNGHDPASAARADATRTDEELMLELAHGRHEALGSLYSRHSRLVFTWPCRVWSDPPPRNSCKKFS